MAHPSETAGLPADRHSSPPLALLAGIFVALFVGRSQAAPPAAPAATGGGTLLVDVSGFHSDRGQLLLRLFQGEAGYPRDGSKAVRQVKQPISSGKVRVELVGVPFGDYAIGCLHDENGNGTLDTNLLGIPKEGVCASNDARGHLGPPKWKDAKFEFRRDGAVLQMKVMY